MYLDETKEGFENYIMHAPKIRVTDVCKDRLHFYSNESAFYILEGSLCIANSALYFLAYRQVLSYPYFDRGFVRFLHEFLIFGKAPTNPMYTEAAMI